MKNERLADERYNIAEATAEDISDNTCVLVSDSHVERTAGIFRRAYGDVAYDDNCKWPAFALTAPVSRFKLVLSKYVILFMTMLVLSVIIFIGSLVMGEDVSGSFFLTVAMFPFGMIMASVLLPIIFKFGVEKGRFAFLAFIAFVVAAVVAGGRKLATLTEDGNIVGSLLSMNRGMMIGAVVLVTAAVAVISIVLSKNIYDKKEF